MKQPRERRKASKKTTEPFAEDRRDFIVRSLMATLVIAVSPSVLLAGTGANRACAPTPTDYYGLGPYYAQGAPLRTVMAPANEPGDRLFITGVVYANDCITPLENVAVDVWHADDNGCYVRFQTCAIPNNGDDYKLRALIRTNQAGAFAFETIKPGRYLNGSQYRPSHIHFKAIHPDIPELVTQLYFEGDPYISVDAAASRPDALTRIIPLTQDSSGLHGVFDIILNITPPTSGVDNPYSNPGYNLLRQNHPNPVAEATTIPFLLAKRCAVDLTVFDSLGRHVRTLVNDVRNTGINVVEWNGTDDQGRRLPTGLYHCRMIIGDDVQVKKIVVE